MLLAVSVSFAGFAQTASGNVSALKFDRTIWDFGVIEEADGPVSHTFNFTNTGKEPIIIERVVVSCGCTQPEFMKDAIMPGESGSIKITYDPTNRPGVFSNDIRVISGGGSNNDKLTIKGDVNPRPRSVEEDYPYELSGGLRLKKTDANFSYVQQSKPMSMTIGYVNTSDKPVKFDFAVTPAVNYLKVTALPTICPGCRGEITITYDMRGSGVYGRINNKITLWVNGRQQTFGITANAIIVDKYQMDNTVEGSRMKLLPPYNDMGELVAGKEYAVEFVVVNEGTQPLIIRAVQPRRDMKTGLSAGTEVAPGGKLKVEASVVAKGEHNEFFADGLYITTNDPVFPMREYRVTGKIK